MKFPLQVAFPPKSELTGKNGSFQANSAKKKPVCKPLSHVDINPKRFQLHTMLQDTHTIRHYQKLTDALVDMWNRGYRFDDLRLYLDGYLAALRHTNAIEPYLIHRLEEEATRYIYDPSNFEMPLTQPESGYY